jgi:uncharacterized membrane protein YcaP (DUF421 family)
MHEAFIVFTRGIIAFATLLTCALILGKRQLSELTYFDYILGITIGSIAASLTTDLSTKTWHHLVGLITWIVAAIIFQLIALKFHYIAKFIDGEPTVVIMNGQIMEAALGKMRMRLTDLLEELRLKGVFDLGQVEFAVLETNGQLSVLKKTNYQPLTPQDLNIPTRYAGISTELIYDGVVVEQNLKQANLDQAWLEKRLQIMGINDPSEVFLAALNTQGELYIDTYRDHVKKIEDVGDYPGLN